MKVKVKVKFKVKVTVKVLAPPQLCLNQFQPGARLNCWQLHAGEKGLDDVCYRIGILLEEERHLVGHFNWQLAQKLFVNIVKTWQKGQTLFFAFKNSFMHHDFLCQHISTCCSLLRISL